MKQNFEIELDDYVDELEFEDFESHIHNHRRRRAHDARRQIEQLMEQRKLRLMLDPFSEL